MPNLATWLRQKDEKWFNPIFARYPDVKILNVRAGAVSWEEMNGLLLTGGADVAPEFLKQEVPDPSVLDKDTDRERDHWEFAAINSSHHQAIDRPGDGCQVEAWCANDDIIEQMRLRHYPFALAVQYHPERGKIYDALFDDFFSRIGTAKALNG